MNRREALKNTGMIGGSALFSTTILSSILQSCQTQERLTWTPQFLSTNQAQLVSALVDTLLPKTDTPGGLDMKVDILIDLFYAKVFDKDGQEGIKAEIDGLADRSDFEELNFLLRNYEHNKKSRISGQAYD